MTVTEFERVFRVSTLPLDLNQHPQKEILQGYLSGPDQEEEVRIRQEGSKYYRAIKTGGDDERGEDTTEISKEEFDNLLPYIKGRPITKTRVYLPGELELNIYHDKLAGLVTLEKEFSSRESLEKFAPPSWLSREVTFDPRYRNRSLAFCGLPLEERVLDDHPPRYDLSQGLKTLFQMTEEKLKHQDVVVVAVAGGSASGKTSMVAEKIGSKFLYNARLVGEDNYYIGKRRTQELLEKTGVAPSWDEPGSKDLRELSIDLNMLRRGMKVDTPVYSFLEGERIGKQVVQPGRVIVLEGLFALNDQLLVESDIRVFVDIGFHGRILRRLLRDPIERGRSPIDILKYSMEVVEPMYDLHIQNTAKAADLIIENEYNASIEASRSGLHEFQVKFPFDANLIELLRLKGADRLGGVLQEDYYYCPEDRNLVETDEMLRLRKENGHSIFTYKGPRKESVVRHRPKLEFELDKDTANLFLDKYGHQIKVISKVRVFYNLGGFVFSVDTVSKNNGRRAAKVGDFVEFRSTEEFDQSRLEPVLSKLGLKPEDQILKSYFDM